MQPIVKFDSMRGERDDCGRPLGLTTYHGALPKKPQRWRIVLAAKSAKMAVRVERDLRPRSKVNLNDLVRDVVLPAIDDAINDARETINELLGVEDSQPLVEISTEFQIYRWR